MSAIESNVLTQQKNKGVQAAAEPDYSERHLSYFAYCLADAAGVNNRAEEPHPLKAFLWIWAVPGSC